MVTKPKSIWTCIECGHQERRWCGQCSQCHRWNTLQEEIKIDAPKRFISRSEMVSRPVRLSEVSDSETPRIITHIQEFDRLIGGGLVSGSLSLIGGSPGIGKSTLLLQLSQRLAQQGLTVLYVCGEESVEQTSLRARRLGVETDNLLLLNETNFNLIKTQIDQVHPDVVVVDSIQIVYKEEISSAPGSVSQVRETASEFMHLAKSTGISIFLVGHVTKSGEIAGPRVLEHLVDTVLYFEGDQQHNYRLVRVVKNRFGGTDEIAVFQMTDKGLIEVANPSQIFLEERMKGVMGSVIIPTIEGTRPILVEIQALVTDTAFTTPSRRCTGLDQNRLALLLAVLEKQIGYQLYNCDVFVSVVGGMKILEPAVDLGILLAIASSLRNQVIDPEAIVIGEVGLGGEVRSIPRVEGRIKEAIHMGFQRCLIPKRNLKGISKEVSSQIRIQGIETVQEAIHALID